MLGKINKFILVLVLFIFNSYSVFAYEYVNQKNKSKVANDITNIYELKEQYEYFAGTKYVTEVKPIQSSNTQYWWPIGSDETEEINGKLFAKSTPASVNISSYFGSAEEGIHDGGHGALDIAPGTPAGTTNVIAARSGTVEYPTSMDQVQFGTGSLDSNDGGQYGNYVKIRHSDGTVTIYAHMYANSITVKSGETVEQGQVIGKVGTSGRSTGVHLHFEMRDPNNVKIDPLQYVNPNNPRPISYGGSGNSFSLIETALSKAEFVSKMNDYATRSGNSAFKTNFADHAEEIYDVSKEAGVNPELVVVTAGSEQSWKLSPECQYTNNYWGLGITNGKSCASGQKFSSLAEGIKGYAETLKKYNPGGSLEANITQKYNDRLSAGCDSLGYGLPGTFSGMQSAYSFVGDYRYSPGSAGSGGCYSLAIVYDDKNYCSNKAVCTNTPCSEESRTTVCEQSDYTAWQVKQKVKMRYDIFGL